MSNGHGATIGYGEEGAFLVDPLGDQSEGGQSQEGYLGDTGEEARDQPDNTNEGLDGDQSGSHESA